jgi:hypothetical protein
MEPGGFLDHLKAAISLESFGHDDPRNGEMAAGSQVRMLFGSDEAAREIEALPHPGDSAAFYFTDRVSEAWVDPAAVDDEVLDRIIKVFAIYGQAGCTSPRKIVLLDGNAAEAEALGRRLLRRWPSVIKGEAAPHAASGNVMARQWGAALGWSAEAAPGHAAVVAWGNPALEIPRSDMFLPVTWSNLEEAAARLPANIQTVGHALRPSGREEVLRRLAAHGGVKRIVPLEAMHHFHHVWDGQAYWRGLFAGTTT